MLFEIFVTLWVVVLAFALYFFVKSMNEAIEKGRQQRAAEHLVKFRSTPNHARHELPTGHRGRRPAH